MPGRALGVAMLVLLRAVKLNWLMLVAAVALACKICCCTAAVITFESSESWRPLSVVLQTLDVVGQASAPLSAPHLSLSVLMPCSWNLKALLANGSAVCRPQT